MNKYIYGLGVLAVTATGAWFTLTAVNSYDYVATVDSEITQLEQQLAELDAAVANGTLTVEQATAAKIAIVKRLDTINSAADRSNNSKLTEAQRLQLVEGLDRLKNILTSYQATLVKVENTADETIVEKKLRRGGSYTRNQTLPFIVADTIIDVEDAIDEVEVIEEDIDGTDESIDAITEETESETITDETTETEPANTEIDKDHTEEDEIEVVSDEVVEETTDEEPTADESETVDETTDTTNEETLS